MHKVTFIIIRFISITFWIGVILALSGCASTSTPVDSVYSDYQTGLLTQYKTLFASNKKIDDEIQTTQDRNSLINGMELLITLNYNRNKSDLYNHKAIADFAGDVAITGLGTAATLVGSSGLKTTLAAIITAVSGTRVSFNSDILQNQSIIAIISEMDRLRSAKILEIEQSKALPIEKYLASQAMIDIIELYDDGNPVTALQGIINDASLAKASSDQALQDIKGTYGADSNTTLLRNYWKPSGVVNKANAKAITDFLAQEKIAVSIPSFLYDKEYADERSKAITTLKLK
jgi:hypothetical protein